ncbi:glutathione S-transferase [Aspergillus californicus]
MAQPIILHGHAMGPNPWKVAIVMEELGIPYMHNFLELSELKKMPYEALNINGRVPAIEDPKTGITLWESGAIIQYLVEQYDKEGTLSYATFPHKHHISQWLHFQMSGQGPYYGQAAWFCHFHPVTDEAAKTRYKNEIKRVLSVLNRHLKGRQYLVGDKCTVADLSFVTWDLMIPWIFGEETEAIEIQKNYPDYYAWHQRLISRPHVAKVLADKVAAKGHH